MKAVVLMSGYGLKLDTEENVFSVDCAELPSMSLLVRRERNQKLEIGMSLLYSYCITNLDVGKGEKVQPNFGLYMALV